MDRVQVSYYCTVPLYKSALGSPSPHQLFFLSVVNFLVWDDFILTQKSGKLVCAVAKLVSPWLRFTLTFFSSPSPPSPASHFPCSSIAAKYNLLENTTCGEWNCTAITRLFFQLNTSLDQKNQLHDAFNISRLTKHTLCHTQQPQMDSLEKKWNIVYAKREVTPHWGEQR